MAALLNWGEKMLILRGHFTSAELAKAFDVSESEVRQVAGDKIPFKLIGQTRKAVLGLT